MTKSDLFWSMIVLICLAIVIGVVAGYNIPKNSQSPDSSTLAGSDLKVMYIPEGTQLIILDPAITLIDTVTDSVTGKRVVTIVKGD